MPLVGVAKRWTFLVDPKLAIRHVDRDVDPMLDAAKVIQRIKELK